MEIYDTKGKIINTNNKDYMNLMMMMMMMMMNVMNNNILCDHFSLAQIKA